MIETEVIHINFGSFRCNLDAVEALDTMTIPKLKKLNKYMTPDNRLQMLNALNILEDRVNAGSDSQAKKK